MRNALTGKVIIVTGAGGGIGREFALYMAGEGAQVVVNDIGAALDGQGRNAGAAQAVVDEIEVAGGQAVANADSVSTWAGAHAIVQTALDRFGRVDGVVNNAGILRDRMFHKMNEEEWRSVIDVHLHGSFFMSRAAAPHFRDQASGSYVHITSSSGLVGNLGQANYGAAKLAVTALSKMIAMDMARYNVRSNCIAPFAWSRMTSAIPADTPEAQARVERLKTMAAAKIAPFAAYLASDRAASVSGQVFAVRANELLLMSQSRPLRSVQRDGGWTVQAIDEHAIPALRAGFYALDRSQDVFSWDPI